MHRMMALALMAMMALSALSGVSAQDGRSDRSGGGGWGWGDGDRGGRAVSYINPDTGAATENADVNSNSSCFQPD